MRPKLYVDVPRAISLYQSGKSLREMSNEMDIPLTRIRDRLVDVGFKTDRKLFAYRERLRKYPIDDTIFKEIDTQEKAYILGFLFADGTVNGKISQVRLKLQSRDEGILEKIKGYLNYDKPLNRNLARGKFHQVSLIICNKQIYLDLQKHGLTPRKSFTCKMPTLRPDLVRHFVRGLFDGNGCFSSYYKGRRLVGAVKILSSSFMIESTKSVMASEFIDATIDHDKRVKEGVDNLNVRKIDSLYKLYSYLYDGATIYLERKFIKFTNYIKEKHDSSGHEPSLSHG